MSLADQKWVALGRLGRARGLKGEIFVDVFNPESTLLFDLEEVAIGPSETKIHMYKIDGVRQASNRWLVSLDQIDSREKAESLTSQYVYGPREAFPKLPDGQFYHCDILGFEVFDNKTREKVGTLAQIMTTPSNEVYVVKNSSGDEFYIPNIHGAVEKIDGQQKVVFVSLPEVVNAN